MLKRFLHSCLLVLILFSSFIPCHSRPVPVSETKNPEGVVRTGQHLQRRWAEAAEGLGSIEFSGRISTNTPGFPGPLAAEGRLGADGVFLALRFPSVDSPTYELYLRSHRDDVEMRDGLNGWSLRGWRAENAPFLAEFEDLYSAAPALSRPQFVDESEDGVQTWEYEVEGKLLYRVRLAPAPLRILSRETISHSRFQHLYVVYGDYEGIRADLVLPRRIIVRNPLHGREWVIEADRISVRPPLPPMAPLSGEQRNALRFQNAIVSDPDFRRLSESLLPDTFANSEAVRQILAGLAGLEAKYEKNPLLSLEKARAWLVKRDRREAGREAREAAKLGRSALPTVARVGALEYEETGDSGLMMWAFRKASPWNPDGLNEMDAGIFADVVGAASEALAARGDSPAVRRLLERAFLLSPSHPRVRDLAIRFHLSRDDETRAIRTAFLSVGTRDSDLVSLASTGELLESLDRLGDAERLYAAASRRFPENLFLRLKLAEVQYRNKRWIEGEATLKELLLLIDNAYWMDGTRRAVYWREAARLQVERRLNTDIALELVERALAYTPEDPRLLETRGMIHLLERERGAAVRLFEKALAIQENPGIRRRLEEARR